MSPLADNEHQSIVSRFTAIFLAILDPDRLGLAFAGVNVSDREEDWINNYREPDVAVFLEGTTARDMGTHWLGGPDLAIEILSLGDPAREKLDFYAKVHVRELLVVDRDPWRMEPCTRTCPPPTPPRSGLRPPRHGEALSSESPSP